ncbi:MAG: phage/plasmid primase, P4 family [Mycobacterium sp.]|uniref:DNA primase family protein n=1 Tax=Mycobacterium sp. TaxID=1785 RepID=UPI003F9D3371
MSDDVDRTDELLELIAEDDRDPDVEPLRDLPSDDYGRESLIAPPGAPLSVAYSVYRRFRLKNGKGAKTLVTWRGTWMLWRTPHWSELDTAQLRSHVYRTLQRATYEHETKDGIEVRQWNPDKRKVANVLEAMEALAHLGADIDPPAWIGLHSAAETSAAQMISCENGFLDLATREIHDHTPALFNVVSVPFAYDENAKRPRAWFTFLDSVWQEDPDSIALLQEYIGYILSGRTDLQKMLLLIGPTRSGKGTIARMLAALVGRGHTVGPTLASLGTNFGLSPLLGKPLAVVSDARLSSNAPTHTIVERLLSITGEDMLTVDRKFRDPWSGKLSTRFVILSNELPKFRDASGAIANRLLILQMTNSFLGREDSTLDGRLAAELPGILVWALEGLDRLVRNGRFTVPGASADAANLMMDLASPMSAFVRDRCVRAPNADVLVDDLYAAWRDWAEENGHKSGAKSTFGRDLRAVVPELQITQPRIGGIQVRRYERIGLKSCTLNADHPVSPVSDNDTAGQDVAADTGYRVSGGGVKPQVNNTDTGDAGKRAFKVQQQANEMANAAYINGMCRDCGVNPYSAGRPRCDPCHEAWLTSVDRYSR